MATTRKPTTRQSPVTVYVQHHPRGHWEILAPGRRPRIACETLDDARRLAYLLLSQARGRELIVRDAYNRVLQRELIKAHPAAR